MPITVMDAANRMHIFGQESETTSTTNDYAEEFFQRNADLDQWDTRAGETDVPDTVRDVISSPGQSLDADIQRTMESEMGDSFSDVQVHTGPRAAQACEDINAKAFTVGNNIAFNQGEYDPGSAEGQHTIAHELAHVHRKTRSARLPSPASRCSAGRQQTGGAVSMLPQDDLDLEIDPDPELEQEAEETAQRVMQGGELGIHRMSDTDVHVQRIESEKALDALDMFKTEVADGEGSDHRQNHNSLQISVLEEEIQIEETLAEKNKLEDDLKKKEELGNTEDIPDSVQDTGPSQATISAKIEDLSSELEANLQDVALTDDQRQQLSAEVDGGELARGMSWTAVKGMISMVFPQLAVPIFLWNVGETGLRRFWEQTEGSLQERLSQVKEFMDEAIEEHAPSDEGDSQGVGSSGEVKE